MMELIRTVPNPCVCGQRAAQPRAKETRPAAPNGSGAKAVQETIAPEQRSDALAGAAAPLAREAVVAQPCTTRDRCEVAPSGFSNLRESLHSNVTDSPSGLAKLRRRPSLMRTHQALGNGSPLRRAIERPKMGKVIAFPKDGGLHHRYRRSMATGSGGRCRDRAERIGSRTASPPTSRVWRGSCLSGPHEDGEDCRWN